MNFSELLKVTSSQLHWSPNGKFCAIATTARLEIKDGLNFQLITIFNCSEYIQAVEWSPDSNLVYTANFKKGIVEVWQPSNKTWRCKIDEGSVGLTKICWSPDSVHLLTTASFYLRVTVWSLISKTIYYIKNPKEAFPGLQFSSDGDYLAAAERHECKDFISIFETKSWSQVKNFEVSSKDLKGLSWSPDNSVLSIWDSPVEYKLLIYAITGQCLASYSAYQWALGIKTISWSPTSQILAIGSYDKKVRLMNHITWKVAFEFEHVSTVDSEDCCIYKEEEENLTGYPATLAAIQGLPLSVKTKYVEEETRPVNLGNIPVDIGKDVNPKVGVSCIEFSFDGRYFATKTDNMSSVVWVWSVQKLALTAILVHCNNVRDFRWCPNRACLAICTGGNHLYMWTPFGAVTVTVPKASTLQISTLRWSPSGSKLALISKELYAIYNVNSDLKNNREESIDS